MRRIPLLLALTSISVIGCVDALGIQSSCSPQMAAVRAQHGGSPPDDFDRDETRGDYTEVWYYVDGRDKYTFRWGVSYEDCQVESGSFVISPAPA